MNSFAPAPTVDGISAFGVSVLYIAFAGKSSICPLGASSVIVFLSSFREQAKHRIFHHITFVILATASIAYFAMASGLSAAYVAVPGTDGVREVFYGRYIDWTITTPLLLLDLTLLAGLPALDTGLMIIADLGMIITGLIGALTPGSAKWFFYVVSCIFFAYVLYGLLIQGRKTSYLRSSAVGNAYVGISVFTVLLWTAYPFVWFFGEGTSMVSPDVEVLVYAVLDVLAKAVFGFWLLGVHALLPEAQVAYPDSWVESGRVLLSE